MGATPFPNRRKLFGLDSNIASAVMPMFYAPLIAAALLSQGWHRDSAFGCSLLFGLVWLCVAVIINGLFLPRFAKLHRALQFVVLDLPLFGALGIVAWVVIRAIWHLMY